MLPVVRGERAGSLKNHLHRCEPSATNEKGYEREFGQGYLEELHNGVLDLLKFVERLKATIGKNFVAERP